eukprot:4834102-Alexandrium_andersonii.AAC.1
MRAGQTSRPGAARLGSGASLSTATSCLSQGPSGDHRGAPGTLATSPRTPPESALNHVASS